MNPGFQDFLVFLAVMVPLLFLCKWVSEKFELNDELVFTALCSLILILSGLLFLFSDSTAYAWRVAPIPRWGQGVFLIGGIVILIMLICHWRKQKKNPVLPSDEDTAAETTQDSLSTEDNAQNPSDDKDKNSL